MLQHAEDCRHSHCHRCGVIDQERELCAHMLRNAVDGRKSEAGFERAPAPHLLAPDKPGEPPRRLPEPAPAQRLLFRVGIRGHARFLSHLETMNAWLRSLRRARLPLSYSEGFHPHPRVAFESARPVAEESLATYMDVVLNAPVDPQAALVRLQAILPVGFRAFSVQEIPLKAPSLMSQIAGTDYVFFIPGERETIEAALQGLLVSESIEVERDLKKKTREKMRRKRGPRQFTRTIDVRPNIRRLEVREDLTGDGLVAVDVSLATVDGRGLRPSELLTLLEVSPEACRVLRTRTRFAEGIQEQALPEDVAEVTLVSAEPEAGLHA